MPEQRAQYLVKSFDDGVLSVLKEKRLDLDMYYGNMTKEIVDICHENGIVVNVWTVKELADAFRMAAYGVDFITTNIIE